MWRRFKEGSLRWQIVTLAVLPIFLVGVLGVMTEPPLPEETELTQAEITAARMAMVADQIDHAETPEFAEALLAATRKSGLEVQRISPFFEQMQDWSLFQERMLAALTTVHGRNAWPIAGEDGRRLIAVEVKGGLLAFAPLLVPSPWLNDDVVNIILSVVIIVLPVALLSIYAAQLISKPLTRIAAAAQAQNSTDPAGTIFDETGPREIRQLAGRLNEMRSRIDSMLKERTAMLRAVSHDLRTPLTRLKLRVERSVAPETAAPLMHDITSINEMIDETLNYLRSDSETEKTRKIDLPSLLRTICSDFTDIGASVSYSGPDRLTFTCRSKALARAVSNLVDNAAKHGDRIGIDLSPQPGGGVRIEVTDNGPGIPADLRKKMLEPFVKGDPSRVPASRSGFGLGLSIAQDVVRRHGGTMELMPRTPKGLVVAIILPATEEAPRRGPNLPDAPPDQGSNRLL